MQGNSHADMQGKIHADNVYATMIQVMTGLLPDASLEVKRCTAAVIEVLATHYFYQLTDDWPLHALASIAGQHDDVPAARQGLATLAALAGSLKRGVIIACCFDRLLVMQPLQSDCTERRSASSLLINS